MPRIRISAAKSQQRTNTFIGATRRNFFPSGKEAQQMIGGLTPGNLSKINASDGGSRVASAIQGIAARSHRNSTDDMGSDSSPPAKVRKNFARGISMIDGDKSGANNLRNLTALAPSAHHRFDKEQVHLRSMYRQLYPGDGSRTTKASTHTVNFVDPLMSQESLKVGDYDIANRKSLLNKQGTLVNPNQFNNSFTRRETFAQSTERRQLGGQQQQLQQSAFSPEGSQAQYMRRTSLL